MEHDPSLIFGQYNSEAPIDAGLHGHVTNLISYRFTDPPARQVTHSSTNIPPSVCPPPMKSNPASISLTWSPRAASSCARRGRNYTGFCPFHANKHTPAFVVWPETGTWRCFGECNEGGDIFKFVMKKEGIDFREALTRLASARGRGAAGLSSREARAKGSLRASAQTAGGRARFLCRPAAQQSGSAAVICTTNGS